MALLGINTATAITLNLYPGYRDSEIPVQREHGRGFDGTYRRAREARLRAFNLPLKFVTASDAAVIQSWWTSASSLIYFEDTDTWPNSAWPVAIANRTKPLDEWMKPYWLQQREGDLFLECRSAF